MPKPGIKYFAGSFLLSIVAVFVAAKAYLLLTLNEQQDNQATISSIKAKNIELFAVNEEEDPLYDKFKKVSQPDNPIADTSENIDGIESVQLATDDVLYQPTDEQDDTPVATDDTDESTPAQDIALLDSGTLDIHDSADLQETTAEGTSDSDDEDLKITDAALAPVFTIPLKHNYNIEGNTVTISDGTTDGQIALASHDVSIYNLGTQNQADVTEPLSERQDNIEENISAQAETSTTQSSELAANVASPQMVDDDPWEVAETGNKHAPKNSLSVKSPKEEAEVALPAQEVQTAYKPQQNILIPIPDDIMKEENLTPQFSSSKENLELEKELRAKKEIPAVNGSSDSSAAKDKIDDTVKSQAPQEGDSTQPAIEVKPVPAQIPADDSEKDFEEQNESNADDATSKSLTESITAWFSGVKNKAADLRSASSSDKNESSATADQKSGSSIFQKLLGPQEEEKNIAPSELKITFQPNKAEISGQTLEWLRAFADNTLHNDSVVVEIRVSHDAQRAIQQKRIKLLYKLLEDKGVDYNKINIIFTNREPNSFIIRNVRYTSEEEMAKAVVKWGDNPW